jgi:hypothetical protein
MALGGGRRRARHLPRGRRSASPGRRGHARGGPAPGRHLAGPSARRGRAHLPRRARAARGAGGRRGPGGDGARAVRARGHGRAHRAASRAAARATAGEVLLLPSGEPALAPFHAACGGHTADPAEAFGGTGTGAAAVPDPGCPARPWRATLEREVLARAVRGALVRSGDEAAAGVPARLGAADLVLLEGAGRWISAVARRGRRAGRWRARATATSCGTTSRSRRSGARRGSRSGAAPPR